MENKKKKGDDKTMSGRCRETITTGTVIMILLMSLLVVAAALQSKEYIFPTNGNINIIGIGVGVYLDDNCTNQVTSIDWGTLTPGDSGQISLYVRNENTSLCSLLLNTTNWNQTNIDQSQNNATDYLKLRWNYDDSPLAPNEIRNVTFFLDVNQTITGISNFSFDMVITAVEA